MTNRLGSAQSPYLGSAAHQPISWYEWGPEPFERAARERKPILLDIGAAWCHWCHVMDAESYEDPEVAALLNDEFVCVKVDRDERPDVDVRYQRAVQGLTGQGGWPLTAFLTPSGEVFFGGTYFPPEGRFGRPGFLSVLRRVREVFTTEPERVSTQAAHVRRFVEAQLDDSGPGDADLDLLQRATRRMLAFADRTNGGFGRAPKFPHSPAVELLLARSMTEEDDVARAVIVETLDAIALGGIRDHVGGGFHRYSTDERWVIPHFEKMCYDNSELLRVYADAAVALERPVYREAATEILRWVNDVLADSSGGYGASQDADVGPHDDGSYFTWSVAQLDETLTQLETKVAIARFGVGTLGRMHHDPTQNVLFVAESVEAVAKRVDLSAEDTEQQIARVVAKLRAARAERRTPFVDRTQYAGWNAMMASAVLRAGFVLEDGAAVADGLAAIRTIKAANQDPAIAHGGGTLRGLLEDQVQVANAALNALEATGDPEWLDWAVSLMEYAIARCWDSRESGFFDQPASPRATGLLEARAKPVQDNPTPAPNGVAGIVLARLFAHTGDAKWDDHRRRLLSTFAGKAEELALFAATYFIALDWAVSPVAHLVITGPADDPTAATLHHRALAAYLPRKVVTRIDPTTRERLAISPAIDAMMRNPAQARGYVCVGTQCLEPAVSAEDWSARLAQARDAARGATQP